MAGPTDTLPTDHRFHRSDTAAATAILWTSVPAGSPPIGHSYVLQNSAPRRATALPPGKPHLFPLLCVERPIANMCGDATATGVAP